jgi:hypothetical protein
MDEDGIMYIDIPIARPRILSYIINIFAEVVGYLIVACIIMVLFMVMLPLWILSGGLKLRWRE